MSSRRPADAGERAHGAFLLPFQESLTASTRPVLWTLWAAVGFVPLIACSNVANLMLVRALARQRDGAIRAALGAHPRQLRALVLGQGPSADALGRGRGRGGGGRLHPADGQPPVRRGGPRPDRLRGRGGGLSLCSLVACWVPELRASRVMPAICLSSD
ncbi:hypothetical protein [Corallococcus sp. EGB]|uniref:hypothetical protein n=1 Tax=Corallococcus sp. EGB TaxID=1521117 RepID=UPI001CBFB9BB|nr:hypothetical protein [Corallococcus sp. EGB]